MVCRLQRCVGLRGPGAQLMWCKGRVSSKVVQATCLDSFHMMSHCLLHSLLYYLTALSCWSVEENVLWRGFEVFLLTDAAIIAHRCFFAVVCYCPRCGSLNFLAALQRSPPGGLFVMFQAAAAPTAGRDVQLMHIQFYSQITDSNSK